jgi:uncharacterized protein (TIGR02145 family)
MKKIKKTVTVGLLSLCSTLCAAQSLNVFVGSPYTIESVKETSGAVYQWLEDGEPILGATDASYTNTTGKASVGTYVYVRMAYKDGCGWATSNAITVNVSYTPPGFTIAFSAFSPDPAAPTGTVWYLTDTREGGNNNTYKVKKLADGNIWMVQDLMFGTCPNNTNNWNNDNSAAATKNEPTVYEGYVGHCRSSEVTTSYLYNWPAAMQNENAYAGTGSFEGCTGTSAGTSSPNPGSCQGICPSGWHIPTGNSDGEFGALYDALNCGSGSDYCWKESSTFEGTHSGAVQTNGNFVVPERGAYKSSTAATNTQNYYMYYQPTGSWVNVLQQTNGGALVRCVMNY